MLTTTTLLCISLTLSYILTADAAPIFGRGRANPKFKKDIQKYLHRYGYWRNGTNENATDEDYQSSIKRFQRYHGLNVTGEMDNSTEKLMNTSRCGVPDNVDANATRHRRYVLYGTKWRTTSLPYFFQNFTKDLPASVIRSNLAKAFKAWSDVSPLTFSETSSSFSAYIHLLFARGDHGDGNPFDGPGGTLAHTFFPPVGDMHFDDDETWTTDSYSGTNFFQVACHEIGHALGLQHTTVKNAVMYPYYRGYDPSFALNADDINGIQAIYGKNPTQPGQPSSIVPTVLPYPTLSVRVNPSASSTSTKAPSSVRVNPPAPSTSKQAPSTILFIPPRNGGGGGGPRRCSFYYYWFGWC